ncbi:MAG: AAA family ATPase [Proteiniphilum sp.]|jgi:exonuclease SbcC|nr:AAA family ATPase [Proteiniphilum sp.]
MKIQAIRIKNLASLDGATEIDFTREPLRSAGIFAITGPTGAGKSTILDALCLALYAKTPRYRLAENGVDIADVKGSTIKQDDVRGVLRDGASNGFAEVDFEGIDGQHYRAAWHVRRAYNREDGSLQPYETSLKNITVNRDIPGRKTELLGKIERLVGLNFEQFTRSVLLAQGDFTAFLKAGRDEKSSLLEKLTGTHVYSEISQKVFEHHREEHQKLRELNLQREGIATLTSEEINDLLQQKAALTTIIGTKEKLRDNLHREISWHEQWSKLQESRLAAESHHRQAVTARAAAQPREERLQQIVRVQPAQPVVNSLQHVREQTAGRAKELEEISSTLASLNGEEKISAAAFAQAKALLDAKAQEEEAARPSLNRAKALDVQLAEKAEQVKQAAEEAAIVREKEKEQKEQFLRTENELGEREKEIAQLNRWRADNESRRPVAEQESLILSKLKDAEGILESLQQYNSRISAAEADVTKRLQEKQRIEEQRNAIQTSLQQERRKQETLHATLSAIPIREIEQEKSSIDVAIEGLITAEAHWKLLYQAINDKNGMAQSLETSQNELKRNAIRLTEAESLLKGKKAERDASLKMLERAKLVAAESVERLRSQLEPGERCPVCGSINHPYTVEHPAVDLLLSGLEATHAENETAYTCQLAAHSSINQSCIELKKSIGELEEKLAVTEASLSALETKWRTFPIHLQCGEHPLPERASWLQEQVRRHKEGQQQLQAQIQSYGKQKEQLEAHTARLAGFDKQFADTENRIRDHERNIKSLQDQQKNDHTEQQHTRKKLDGVKQTLSVYFPTGQWFENWQADPEAFVSRIREFAGTWKTNIIRLEELIRQQGMLTEKNKGMQEQLKRIREESESKEQYLSKLQIRHKELSGERASLFHGAPVNEVETTLKEAAGSAKQAWEQQREAAEKIRTEITRNRALQEQIEKEIHAFAQQESALKEQLGSWIDRHNRQYGAALTQEDISALLTFTPNQIEAERKSLRELDDAVMQAGSILEERTKALDAHTKQRPSESLRKGDSGQLSPDAHTKESTSEELTALLEEVREQLKQTTQQVNEIEFRIKEDTLNRRRIGALLRDIEKQASVEENWAKLNEIIGSSDGKKFRQIAQEYTLDVLLSYANAHLETLSKRYILQRIPDSLGLQVIDQDMGDEARTVYSLSGGESFLVSLALALGLASLSSSRMKVESLFIDEGFGSLDPATLNIAMDALDRLHNQGRKVGVISHVQEMTERIPVQIRVSKQQSGKSKVEIIGI